MITVIGSNTTYEQLADIPLTRPSRAGSVWRGVPHHDLVEAVLEECRMRKWKVNEMKFALSEDKADLAGAIALTIPSIKAPEGMDLSLGVLTSNALRRRMRIVVGAEVRVCHNGMCTGEVVMCRKHTSRLDLYREVEEGLNLYLERAKTIPDTVKVLREKELPQPTADHFLLEAGRQSLLPWSRIGQVDKQYRHPRFAEHGKGTAWALLNAFTWVVKQSNPLRQMDQINQFRQMLLA